MRRALLLAALVGCGEPSPSLDVRVVKVGTPDPLAAASRVRAQLLDADDHVVAETTFSIADHSSGFDGDIPFAPLRATIEALDAQDRVVARGGTALADLDGADATLTVFVGAVDRFWSTVDAGGAPTALDDPVAIPTATALDDGTVLIAGGAMLDAGGAITGISQRAYLFDPGTGRYLPLPDLAQARAAHTATALRPDSAGNRLVLITGGITIINDQVQPSATAELFDPRTRTFAMIPAPLGAGRAFHSATLLIDGTVLLAGGMQPAAQPLAAGPHLDTLSPDPGLASAEIYTPGAAFSGAGDTLDVARWGHVAARGANGRVLLAGGRDAGGNALASTTTFDPGARRFDPGPALTAARAGAAAARLGDNAILVIGGRSLALDPASTTATTDVIDLAAGSSAPGPALSGPRAYAVATLLADGRAIVTGGFDVTGAPRGDADVLALAGAARATDGGLTVPRGHHAAAALPGDTVLIVGGQADGQALAQGEVYVDPLQ